LSLMRPEPSDIQQVLCDAASSNSIIDQEQLQSPIGLVAGNGSFPIEFAINAKKAGLSVVAVAHTGETDPLLETLVSRCVWVKVGQLGKIIKILKKSGVRQAAFAGGIKRVKLFGGVKLDLRGLTLIARLKSVKDDVLLRGIAEELETSGISVFSPGVLLKESLISSGALTRRALTKQEVEDAIVGWEAAKAMGSLDIGQTVLTADGIIIAVEAVEGTDEAIKRGGKLAAGKAVVVKVCKPQQDLRLDLPTIGLKTINTLNEANVKAIVIESGKTIVLHPDEVVKLADKCGVAIYAAASVDELKNLFR